MSRQFCASLLGVAVIVSLGGCVSLLPKVKPAQLYRFGAETTAPTPGESPSGADKTGVVLGTIGFPRASTSDGILTVTGDETAYLAGVRWVAPARLLFQEALQREFEQRSRHAQLVNVGDVGPAGAILRVDVTSFEARYTRGGGPKIVVTLTARLTRSDGRLLDQRDFSAVQPAGSNSISAIVRGFDQATDKVLTDVAGWTDGEVASIPAASPPAPSAACATAAAGAGAGGHQFIHVDLHQHDHQHDAAPLAFASARLKAAAFCASEGRRPGLEAR